MIVSRERKEAFQTKGREWMILTTVGLIRPVTAVVISITVVDVQNATTISTLKLLNTACGCHHIRCWREKLCNTSYTPTHTCTLKQSNKSLSTVICTKWKTNMWPWSWTTKAVLCLIYTPHEGWINKLSIDVWFVRIGQYLAEIQQLFEIGNLRVQKNLNIEKMAFKGFHFCWRLCCVHFKVNVYR